ncbi:uncharacterized protein [Triticum aestivum]|uniref:uncharacterized protein isoform X1 n=1 Tax=Triticum aestivum TaxID=4565 RepID=UPI001D02CD1F|nr:uncharacterized protein LOC123075799 isoform X1 [Triticum aestivum]
MVRSERHGLGDYGAYLCELNEREEDRRNGVVRKTALESALDWVEHHKPAAARRGSVRGGGLVQFVFEAWHKARSSNPPRLQEMCSLRSACIGWGWSVCMLQVRIRVKSLPPVHKAICLLGCHFSQELTRGRVAYTNINSLHTDIIFLRKKKVAQLLYLQSLKQVETTSFLREYACNF